MENYFEKFKNDIIAGAESGFETVARGEEAELTNHYECEADSEEIDNITEMGTALYSDRIREIAEGELVAGGEAAVMRAAYRAKTMAKGSTKSVVNAFNKLIGRTSNIDKIMTKISSKAKAAKKGLEKSGLPKDSEAKVEFPKDLNKYLTAMFKFIKDDVLGGLATIDNSKIDANELTGLSIDFITAKSDEITGVYNVEKTSTQIKTHLEDYSASDVMDALKDAHEKIMDDTAEISLSVQKQQLNTILTTIETTAKTVKSDKAVNNLRKTVNKLAGIMSKQPEKPADAAKNKAAITKEDISASVDIAQQVASAVNGQIAVFTRLLKFTELACDKVVTSARALEAKLPSDK